MASQDLDYVINMMATGSNFIAYSSCKRTSKEHKDFAHNLLFDWPFHYRQAIDDHNDLYHLLPSIEKSWITQYRECNVFSVILAIIKVIALLCICCTKGKENF